MSAADGFWFELGRGAARVIGGLGVVAVLFCCAFVYFYVAEWIRRRRA